MDPSKVLEDLREKALIRRQLDKALSAVQKFRESNDPGNFPDLRSYLSTNYGGMDHLPHTIVIDGVGQHQELIAEEYQRFKAAFLETPAGKQDHWTISPW